MKQINGSRFITGEQPVGMGFVFYGDSPSSLMATVTLDERHEGPPQHGHGGFSSALIDEAMGGAVWRAGYRVVAANLNINFRLPVPLGMEVTVRGWVERVEGRKVFAAGNISLADGRVAVEGTGLFIEAPELFRGSSHFENAIFDEETT
jgi:uncharacterized protein (TIGR00369 family)